MAWACPLVLKVRNESDPGELAQNKPIKISFHELPPTLLPDSQGTDSILVAKHIGLVSLPRVV